MHRTACCVILMVSVAACSHPSTTTYGDTEVGRTIETAQGSVVSSRIVAVSGDPGYVGAGAGAAIGAAGGSLAVNGAAGLLVAIVGGLVGAGIGYFAEKEAMDRDGIEYVLKMDDGRLVTLVQNRASGEQPLADGTPVLVQLNGQYTRIMEHPGAVDYNAPGGWVDPDTTGGPGAAGAPGAAEEAKPGEGGGNLLFQGGDVVERPAETAAAPPASTGAGQQ